MAGELVAEFFGTVVIVPFGDGVVATVVTAPNETCRGEPPSGASRIETNDSYSSNYVADRRSGQGGDR